MKAKLIYKFVITYVISAVLSFIVISTLGSHLNYKQELKHNANLLYKEANFIALNYATNYYTSTVDKQSVLTQLRAVSTYIECDVMLISTTGIVILDTGNTGVSEIDKFDPARCGNKSYSIDNFYGIYDHERISTQYPVVYEFRTRGYVVISKPVGKIKADAESSYSYNYLTLAFCYAFIAVIFVLFTILINNPLRRITTIVGKYAKGDFSEKINIKRNDEIGMLSDSLDYMATEINSLNEYQKKFIANISHDFRSPLTSIKGYLEAMLDGTIPPEMQEKYLNIVITETERLTKLTNNLLTMNNITDKGMVLDISTFDIVAIIKSTIETFQGTCEKKRIKFKLIFSDKALQVNADQSKIQQVIYNLIDNAIKFSSNDSSIIISATEKGEKIYISIKDFGIGIPKDSIPKIWDRFYKTDLSRGKDKKGTGLGLSIVKEIIASHNEYIDVISTEGVGTEFTFTLPKSKESRTPFLDLD